MQRYVTLAHAPVWSFAIRMKHNQPAMGYRRKRRRRSQKKPGAGTLEHGNS